MLWYSVNAKFWSVPWIIWTIKGSKENETDLNWPYFQRDYPERFTEVVWEPKFLSKIDEKLNMLKEC